MIHRDPQANTSVVLALTDKVCAALRGANPEHAVATLLGTAIIALEHLTPDARRAYLETFTEHPLVKESTTR